MSSPSITSGDCTASGSNATSTLWTVSTAAAVTTGDLVIFYIAWDDSTTCSAVTASTGPNAEVLTQINVTPVTDASTETRAKAWWTIATSDWPTSSVRFTPSAGESRSATSIRVAAGTYNSTAPIGASSTFAATGTGDVNISSAGFTAGATDIDGVVLWCAGVDADPTSTTPAAGWTILQRLDLGAVAHGVAVRNAAVTSNSEVIPRYNWGIEGDSWTSINFIVRGVTSGVTPVFKPFFTGDLDGLNRSFWRNRLQ